MEPLALTNLVQSLGIESGAYPTPGEVATGRKNVSLPNGQVIGVDPYSPGQVSGTTAFNQIIDGAFSQQSDDVNSEIDRFKTETSIRKSGQTAMPPNASTSDGINLGLDALDTTKPKAELSDLEIQRMNLLQQAFPNIPQRQLASYADLPKGMRSVALGFAVARALRGDTTGALESLVAPFQVRQSQMDADRDTQLKNIQQQAAMAQEQLRSLGAREEYLYKDILTRDSQVSQFVLGLKGLQEQGRQFDSKFTIDSAVANHQISADQGQQLLNIFQAFPGDPQRRAQIVEGWMKLNPTVDPKLAPIFIASAGYESTGDKLYRETFKQAVTQTSLLGHQDAEALMNEAFNRFTYNARVAGYFGDMKVKVAEGNRAADKIDAEIKEILSRRTANIASAGKDNAQAGLFNAETSAKVLEHQFNNDFLEATKKARDISDRIGALDPKDPLFEQKRQDLQAELVKTQNEMSRAQSALQGFQGAWATAKATGNQGKMDDEVFKAMIGRATKAQDNANDKKIEMESRIDSLGNALSPFLKGGYDSSARDAAANATLSVDGKTSIPWIAPGSSMVQFYDASTLVQLLHEYARGYGDTVKSAAKADDAFGGLIDTWKKAGAEPDDNATTSQPAPKGTMKPSAYPSPNPSAHLEFSNAMHSGTRQDEARTNPNLRNDLASLAERLGFRVTVTTANTGHRDKTTSGNPSRHKSGNAVDITSINGIDLKTPEGKRLGDQYVRALVDAGYSLNSESGFDRAVFWQTNKGGNHFNHIHVSNRIRQALQTGV